MGNISTNMAPHGTPCINPASGEITGYAPLNSVADLKRSIVQAREAQKEWAAVPIHQRVKKIRKIGTYIYDHAEEIAELISNDTGKTLSDGFGTEVLPSLIACSYYCRKANKYLRPFRLSSSTIFFIHKRSKILRVPWGVIGIISPWNYPFSIPFYQVIMGLIAGNAVILKVASESQRVGEKLAEVIMAAGLPEGLFTHINLPGREIGEAFLANGIDKLFFTGSSKVGKKLMARAADFLTPINLELGGNDAMIICADADLNRAAEGAVWAGFMNCGQSCGGVERVYVHASVYPRFLDILKQKTEAIRAGQGHTADMGVMTTESQIATVNQQLESAIRMGAKIFARSPEPSDPQLKNFLPAIILTDVNHQMEIMREETFGPVIGVMPYENIDQAIEMANDCNLGLTGSVWSKNRKKAEQIGGRVQAGVISINDHLMSHGMPETPWGGFKESGMGRSHGSLGFEEMTQSQVIINDYLPYGKRDPWWFPNSEKVYQGLIGIMDLLFSKNPLRKSHGLWQFLKIVPRIFFIRKK